MVVRRPGFQSATSSVNTAAGLSMTGCFAIYGLGQSAWSGEGARKEEKEDEEQEEEEGGLWRLFDDHSLWSSGCGRGISSFSGSSSLRRLCEQIITIRNYNRENRNNRNNINTW